jgi:hypothetical protein
MLLFASLIFVVAVIFILLIPVLWGRESYANYSAPRAVVCPETHQQVGVTLDARHAAASWLHGTPNFRLADCTRWPERGDCGQDCLPDALRAQPYTQGEVRPNKARRPIYHLPVFLAGFAAWYIGAWWHSQFLFRARWMSALHLTPAQLKQVVHWYSPHLLSILACLLFAYGVAALLSWASRKGLWKGIICAIILWAALELIAVPMFASLSRDVLFIETGYTLVAAIAVGAIVGGLSGKLVIRTTAAGH